MLSWPSIFKLNFMPPAVWLMNVGFLPSDPSPRPKHRCGCPSFKLDLPPTTDLRVFKITLINIFSVSPVNV